MIDILAEWKYTALIDESRRNALAEPGSFEELVGIVVDDVRNVQARAEPGRETELTKCFQPVFTFQLPITGDPLFNGPWGYRAQYWISPGQGLGANRTLLGELTPRLLAAGDSCADPNLARFDVGASLAAASAKIWINETQAHWTSSPGLDVDRWVLAAGAGNVLALTGIRTPEVIEFEVKGALIDPHGHEVVPRRKILRHYDIHDYGFT